MLISLFLGALLLSVLIKHYLTLKKQTVEIQAKLEPDLELTLIEVMIRNSIRHSGFTPCLNLRYLKRRNEVYNEDLNPLIVGKTLVIKRMSKQFVEVLNFSPYSLAFQAKNRFLKNDRVIISDCFHAEVAQVTFASQHSIGLKNPLYFHYQPPIFVGELIEETYFIHLNHNGKSELYYKRKHPEALSVGIETFSSQLEVNRGMALVKVLLGLANKQRITLETMVRSG